MLALSALVAFGLAGPPTVAAASAAAAPRGPSCVAVEVASPQDLSRPGRVPEFSASAIIDLRLTAALQRPGERGVVKLKLFTPQGHLYQTLAVPFVTGGGGAPQARHVDGSSRSVLEQRAVPAAAGADYRVEARLPVAGTLIVSEGLFGRWTVEPWLNEDTRPCLAARPFVINP
jgi:hypothetical protein